MTYLPPHEDELNRIAQANADRARTAALAAQANPQVAQLLRAHAAAAPWNDPQVTYALAASGTPPDDPLAAEVSTRSAKKRDRTGWARVGELVNPFDDLPHLVGGLGTALSTAGKGVAAGFGAVTKPVIRGAMTALSAPLEEVQGVLKAGAATAAGMGSFSENYSKVGHSALANVFEDLLHGRRVDMGTGFFAGGEIAEETLQETSRLQYKGQSITLGRVLADTLLDPGDLGYGALSGFIDGAVAVGADPSNFLLGGAGKAIKARQFFAVPERLVPFAQTKKLLGVAGGAQGRRSLVAADRFDQWMASSSARRFVDFAVDSDSADSIWKATGKKIDPKIAHALSQAPDEATVSNIMREAVLNPQPGMSQRLKPSINRLNLRVRQSKVGQMRSWGTMPGARLDLSDMNTAVEQLDRLQKNARLAPDVIAANNNKLMALDLSDPTSHGAAYRLIVEDVIDNGIRAELTARGVDPAKSKAVTRLWADWHEEFARYAVDEVGDNVAIPGIGINGAGKPIIKPHLFTELLRDGVPLPDARDIRLLTSRFAKLMDNPAWESTIHLGDFLMQQIWKPAVLLRGAWTVRVVGEEQIRLATAGYHTSARHPLSVIATLLGRESTKITRRGAISATGDDVLSETTHHAEAMAKARTMMNVGGARYRRVDTKFMTTHARGSEDYARSWVGELLQLFNDPVSAHIARHGVASAKDQFWAGPLQKYRRSIGDGTQNAGILADRAISDQYIDSVMARIQAKTANDTELLDAIRTGSVRGVSLSDAQAGRIINEDATKILKEFADRGVGPERVKGALAVQLPAEKSGDMNRAVQFMFKHLMTQPTNRLSRSPVFRQSYWQRIEELLPQMDSAAQRTALGNAAKANLGKEELARLQRVSRVGNLSLEDADLLAKDHALESTRSLLYDLSDRSQWADQMRLLTPFAEAWKEVTTTWAGLLYQNPRTVRRFQQTVQGARSAGLFTTDPETGEEVFVFPGSRPLSRMLTGTPVDVTAPVRGLNLFSQSLLPGFGPVVQIAASKLLPDRPEWDDVRSYVLPYGEASLSDVFTPAVVRKFKHFFTDDPEADRLYANQVSDQLSYLVSTGEFDPSTPEGQEELLAEAKNRARKTTILIGLASQASPSSPRARYLAEDEDGDLMVAQIMINRFQELQKEDFDTAVQRFTEEFGEGAFLLMQPRSHAIVAQAPTDSKGAAWARRNPRLLSEFPNTYGFFAPQSEDPEDFDYTAYVRQYATGERQALSPDQVLKLANDRVASAIYWHHKNQAGARPSRDQQLWLRNLKATLRTQYPGFDEEVGQITRAPTDQMIRELERAAEDPTIAKTKAGKAMSEYLQLRSMALENAEASEVNLQTGKAAAPLRAWLRQAAGVLQEETPEFQFLWDRVFDRELADDLEDLAPTPPGSPGAPSG